MKKIGLLLCLMWLLPLQAAEKGNADVDRIIAAGERPEGVVFELAVWGDDSWDWAAPMLRDLVGQLRQAYPGLEVALVSHGYELFDLSHRSGKGDTSSIRLLESIAADDVDIHVCGNFAGTRFYEPEDFFAFVDVAPSGPSQLEAYLKLGFTLVVLDAPDGFD